MIAELFDATRRGDLRQVRSLIERGLDVNATDDSYATALFVAARHRQLEVARYLLDAGADPNAIAHHDPDSSVTRPLTPGELAGRDRMVERLSGQRAAWPKRNPKMAGIMAAATETLTRATTITQSDYLYYAPLHVACRLGDEAMIELLIARGANLELAVVGSGRRRPLHVAALFGQAGAVQRLITAGAHVDAVAEFHTRSPKIGRTALSYAVQHGHSDVVGLLEGADATTVGADVEGLMRAVEAGDVDTATRMLAAGVAPDATTPDHRSPFLAACSRGSLALVKAFLSRGITITGQALENAASREQKALLLMLLTEGTRFAVSKSKVADVRRIAKKHGWQDVLDHLKAMPS